MIRLIAVLCLVALAGPGAAMAGTRDVRVPGRVFNPVTANIVVGDQVRWMNQSSEEHDLTGPSFNETLSVGETWLNPNPFITAELVFYSCTIHPGMQGAIHVHEVYLKPLAAAVTFGNAMGFSGLASSGIEVQIERFAESTWTPVGAPKPATTSDAFSIPLKPAVPGMYRATTSTGESPEIKVAVKPRVTLAKKRLPRKRTRVTVAAAPNRAGAMAVLQRKKPAGWAAIATKRLGTNSKAAFVVRPPKGTWRVRALVKASGGYAAGQSGVIAVKR